MLAVMQPKNYLMHGLGVGGGPGRPKGSRNGYKSPGAAFMKYYDVVGERAQEGYNSNAAHRNAALNRGDIGDRADPNQSSKKNEIKRDMAKTQAAKNEAMNDRSAMQYTNPSRLPGVSSNSSSGKAPSSQTGSQSSVAGTSVPYEGTNAPLSRDAAEKVSELREAAAEESYQGKDFFGRLLQNPGRALSEAWNQGVSWLRGVGKRVTDWGKAAWDKIVSGATAIGNAAKQGYNAAKDFVLGKEVSAPREGVSGNYDPGDVETRRVGGIFGQGGYADQAGRAIGNAASKASKWVGNAANDARNFVMGTPTTTSVTTFDENGRAVQGTGKVNYGGVFGRGGFVDQAGRWGQNAINDIGEAATNAYNDASGWVQNQALPWINQAGVDIGDAAKRGYLGAQDAILGREITGSNGTKARYGGLTGQGGFFDQAGNFVQNQALPWAQQAGRDIGNAAVSAYDAVSEPVSRAANSIGAYLAERPANQLPQEASLMQGSRIVDPDTGRIGNGFTVPDGNGGYVVGIYYPDTRTFRYLDQNDIYGRGR